MRVAVGQIRELTDEKLRYAAQLGVSGVQINTPMLPGETHWEADVLREQVRMCERYGLKLESIENVPSHFYNKAMLGLPGRDEQIAYYQTTIRNCGEAGVPILGFHFIPSFVWRTEWLAPTRGGAGSTKFDLAAVERVGSVPAAEVEARLAALAGAYVRFATRHAALLELMFASKHRPDAADSLRAAGEAAFAAPLALITEGQASGAVVPGDPEAVATVAWAAVQGLASIANAGMLDEAALDGIVAGAVERLVLGLRPR